MIGHWDDPEHASGVTLMANQFRTHRLAVAGAGLAVVLMLGNGRPAFAFEDGKGSMWDAMLEITGMGPPKDDDSIQYRERAPLVVPPKSELRQPLPPPSQRVAAWPQDQEVVRARKKAQERGAQAPRSDAVTAAELKYMGRIDPSQQQTQPGPQRDCNMDPFDRAAGCAPGEYWNKLAQGPKPTEKTQLQAGVEAPREWLTQPPSGYMVPKTVQRATFEPYHKEEADPRDYFLKKPTDEQQ